MEEKRRFDDKYFLSQLNKLTPTLSLGLIKEQMKTAIDTDNMSELLQSLESYRHASTITQKIALREMNEYVKSFIKNEETEITGSDPKNTAAEGTDPNVTVENPAAEVENVLTDIVIDTIEDRVSNDERIETDETCLSGYIEPGDNTTIETEEPETASTLYPYLEPGDNVEIEPEPTVKAESTVETEEPETVSDTVEMVIENVEEDKASITPIPIKKSSSRKK